MLIDRTTIAEPQQIDVEAFIALNIDYAGVGNAEAQSTMLMLDLESVSFRTSAKSAKRDQVDKAFERYLKRIHNRRFYSDRMCWGMATDMPLEVFTAGNLDYRGFGDRRQQEDALMYDYKAIGRAAGIRYHREIDAAYHVHLDLITGGYLNK